MKVYDTKIAILLFSLIFLLTGCEEGKRPVTVFILDSASLLTFKQIRELKDREFTHGKIIEDLIKNESAPNNIKILEVDKVIQVRNEETYAMEEEVVIDSKKVVTALKRIDHYVGKHPKEKIVVNMSFGGYSPLIFEILSENPDISGPTEEEFAQKIFKKSRNDVPDFFFNRAVKQYIESINEDRDISQKDIDIFHERNRLISELHEKGVIFVAAAGNENTEDRSYPAAHPDVIAVAAIDKKNSKASYSNYGKYLDIAAQDDYTKDFDGSWMSVGGTSFACARVTALIVNILRLTKEGKEVSPISLIKSYSIILSMDDYGRRGLLGAGAINPEGTLESLDSGYTWTSGSTFFEGDNLVFIAILIIGIILIAIKRARPIKPETSSEDTPPSYSPPPCYPTRPQTPDIQIQIAYPFPCPNGSPVPLKILIMAYEGNVVIDKIVRQLNSEIERLEKDYVLFKNGKATIQLIQTEIQVVSGYVQIFNLIPHNNESIGKILQSAQMLIIDITSAIPSNVK